jgi:hypothetical protein
MCTVLLPPGDNPIAIKNISYHIINPYFGFLRTSCRMEIFVFGRIISCCFLLIRLIRNILYCFILLLIPGLNLSSSVEYRDWRFRDFLQFHKENAKQSLRLGHERLILIFIQRIIHYIYFILSTTLIIWTIVWVFKLKKKKKCLFLSSFLLSYSSLGCSIFVGSISLGRTDSHSSPIPSTHPAFHLRILHFIRCVSVALVIHSTDSSHFLSSDELFFCFTCVCI